MGSRSVGLSLKPHPNEKATDNGGRQEEIWVLKNLNFVS